MIILGIDPGLRTTGFGLIKKQGQQISYLASGTIKTIDGALPDRLKTIFTNVREIITQYRPDCAAVEKVFVNVNPQSTLLLGQARGASISALVDADLAVAEYTALQIKQSVAGHGKAKKEQVQEMVQRLLHLPSLPGPDAADALGVAICHAHSGEALAALSNLAPGLAKRGLRVRAGRLIG